MWDFYPVNQSLLMIHNAACFFYLHNKIFISSFVGTNRYFQRVVRKFGIEITLVDCTDLEKVKGGIKENTKVDKNEHGFYMYCMHK